MHNGAGRIPQNSHISLSANTMSFAFTAVPPAIAATLPKRAQQLIGYRSSHALNFIEGLDDNHVLSH
jgi:hypothetical protein